MLRILYILILLPFVAFSQLKTDSQLTNDLNNLIPNNTSQLIKPVHVRTVIQNGYDSRVSMYGETGILGKLTYATLFPFTDPKDIVNKKYVDDAVVGFSGGVTSFNARTGAITPLSTDYSAYYYPATGNPSGFLTSSPVSSVFARTGAITAQPGDYNTFQVTENTNLYFTNARARLAFSVTPPLTYNSTTGVLGSNRLNVTLATYTTVLAYSANTEVDYFSYTIPANTLTANGDAVAYEFNFFTQTFGGSFYASGLIEFNGSQVCKITSNNPTGTSHTLRLVVTRQSASEASFSIFNSNINNTSEILTRPFTSYVLSGLNFSAGINIKSRVSEDDTTNPIYAVSARVTFEPAP